MKAENKIMLITYPDSLGGNLRGLKSVLDGPIRGAVGSVHILPFFPSSGDRGFAPIDYSRVEPAYGNWDDIKALAEGYPLMFDFMVNHLSRRSPEFLDFLQKKDSSRYSDLFLRWNRFWQNGEPTPEEARAIYKRKPKDPSCTVRFDDGSTEKIWNTFGEEQMDLDVRSETTMDYIEKTIRGMVSHGASLIRLDAFAYAVKKAGTSCFFVEPEIWALLSRIEKIAASAGADILPEIHEHHSIQQKLAGKGYAVYDFALPMLILHALYYGEGKYLADWLSSCPRRQYTTLDTHDGIGVVDVRDLLPDEEIEKTKDALFTYGANVKRVYNTPEYHNLDIYQINCTYYSALGNRDKAYLLARAIQFFAPGIPQVYYVGMLAGKNDIARVERTKEGREINRHMYDAGEIKAELERNVVKELLSLMRFRNTHPAFGGSVTVKSASPDMFTLRAENGAEFAELRANLKTHDFCIVYSSRGFVRTYQPSV